ncbi:AP-5 complex subunit mu-1 isoform X2 [Cryptotermes secundus]|uniref:AP-5 complex subunit mu-1 isoform X2 n=1 Tax=Cryptotermes secundus TaxID=105785 RepID=UPI000CD7D8CA|nr:AP-5 complex subunit mu-1 isoform X2 [Cryptotermes secundus]
MPPLLISRQRSLVLPIACSITYNFILNKVWNCDSRCVVSNATEGYMDNHLLHNFSLHSSYTRHFSIVEACSKSVCGDAYIGIPSDESFVKALRTEVALIDAGTFVESRDSANKPILYPTFEIVLKENKSLWPVVVLENQGLLYCALPLIQQEVVTQKDKADITLADLPGVSLAVEALNGLVQCAPLTSSMTSLNTALTMQVHQFVNTCMSFGRVTCSNPFLVSQLINPSGKGKAKPLWNPVPHKAKSQVIIHIKEEVRCMQFNHNEVRDAMDVYGSVTCKSEVEGTAPEICITLIQPGGNDQNINGGGLTVSSAVSSIEYTATTSRLRFRPCNNQPLCHYTLPHLTKPPIYGEFKLRLNKSLVTVYLQLQLQAGIRNHFQQLEAHIPFYGLQVSIVKPSSSVGSVSVQSGSTLVWNVGSKFPTKLLNATLSTVCKLRRKIDSSAEQEVGGKDMNGWEQFTSSCALVLFKMADYTYSGTRVDPQSIMVSSAPKVRCTVTTECVSSQYKIWNSEAEVPSVTDMPVQDLQKLLIE